jgi:hypothetical protein
MGIFLADLDPHPFQLNVQLNCTFSQKISIQNIENYDTYDDDEKDKTKKTGTAANKSTKKIFDFPKCSKLGVGSGSAARRCRSTTLLSIKLLLTGFLIFLNTHLQQHLRAGQAVAAVQEAASRQRGLTQP